MKAETDLERQMKALNITADCRTKADQVFDRMVAIAKKERRPVRAADLYADGTLGLTRSQVQTAINKLVFAGRVLAVESRSGLYVPKVV